MRASCLWGRCPRLAGGGRILRLVCTAERSAHTKPEPSPTSIELEHLQRSLDLGPAVKQAPDFEYVAVAFRSQKRSKRSKVQPQDSGVGAKHKDGLIKIFGKAQDSRGYRTLEVVSGDRRLLFEPSAGGTAADAAALPEASDTDSATMLNMDGANGAGEVTATQSARARPTRPRRRQPRSVDKPEPSLTAPVAAASAASPTSSAATSAAPLEHPAPSVSYMPAAPHMDTPAAASPANVGAPLQQQHHPHHQSQPLLQHQQQQQQHPHIGAESSSNRGRGAARAATRLAAAAALLQLPPSELRRHRGFCSELRVLELTPSSLAGLHGALVGALGLQPAQLRDALLCQPHVLRVPAGTLARRGAALAMELQLPPPPGPGGGGALAAIVAAVPDVLLRRAGYAGTAAALAAALALSLEDALELLRREPQLLRHPPGFYARGVGQLVEQLGLPPPEAAALAAAEPQLLAVSPGVLRANGVLLRSRLQLSPLQLAEVVERAPELLVRSPGVVRSAVQRLTAVLTRSVPWRAALPRLLAAPRNLAVALSFSSERYDRLEYLAATGRDGFMGFKEGLSMEDGEFQEMFPEYVYNVWRLRRAAAAPVSHRKHAHASAREGPVRAQSQDRGQ